MTISKFESNLSPGLKELGGFRYKIPDAGVAPKPFDFVLGLPTRFGLLFVGVEGKTARGGRFDFTRGFQEHQRNALQYVSNKCWYCAWIGLHYRDTDVPAFLLPWCVYVMVEARHSISIPVDQWPACYHLSWDDGPTRKARYWRVPEEHPLRRVLCRMN